MKNKSKKVISVDISDDDIRVKSVSDDDTCAMSVDISATECVSSNSDTGIGNEGGIRE